ncbi:MAG TPA: P1 family peptidase [Syntrophomonadaceae bacterium]|nr:P1 family peptidase [Syntrophomonadaceae bacterium]
MNRSITAVEGITIGCQQDLNALTGCTVVMAGHQGAVCGVDVRGSSPGTRETDLLLPINLIDRVHAVVLSGGSAFGLDAAGGVMEYLEVQGIGHPVGPTVVPIVPAAVLYDLEVGDYRVRPDRAMGYQACKEAGTRVPEGNAGAGTGATVGKTRGYQFCTKSGQGTWAVSLANGLTVGAIVAVNALGDVVDHSGRIIAGVRDPLNGSFPGTLNLWKETGAIENSRAGQNTTIAVIACNAQLNKSQATKVAQMAHNGLARVISPVHTMYDGDTIFALATGQVQAETSLVGSLAAEVLAQAVVRAVQAAITVQGCRAWRD